MRRALPVAVAFLFAFCAYAFQAVQLPGRALACSCVEVPPSLAEEAANNPVTIVAGTIGVAQPDRTPVVVDTWFHGEFVTDRLWLRGGTDSMSSCDVSVSAGERRVMVLWGGPPNPRAPGSDGMYSTSLCSANAVIGTAEGNALLAQATDVFGAGDGLPDAEPEPAAPIDLAPWLGTGTLIAVAAVGGGLLVLAAVTLFGNRRPQD